MAQRSNRISKGRQTKPSVANAERSLRELNRQWAEALKNRDKNALDRILDDQYISTGDEGQVSDKRQWINAAMGAIPPNATLIFDVELLGVK